MMGAGLCCVQVDQAVGIGCSGQNQPRTVHPFHIMPEITAFVKKHRSWSRANAS